MKYVDLNYCFLAMHLVNSVSTYLQHSCDTPGYSFDAVFFIFSIQLLSVLRGHLMLYFLFNFYF